MGLQDVPRKSTSSKARVLPNLPSMLAPKLEIHRAVNSAVNFCIWCPFLGPWIFHGRARNVYPTNRVKFTSKIHREIHGKIHGPVNFRIRAPNWAHFWSAFACPGEGHFGLDLEGPGSNTRLEARFDGHVKMAGDTCPHVFHIRRAKIHHHNFVRGGTSENPRFQARRS